MRGSIIKFDKRRLCGCILKEDGRKVLFDKASLDGLNTRLLSLGDKVEFQEQYAVGVLRASKIRFSLYFTGSSQNYAGPSETRLKRTAAKSEANKSNGQVAPHK
jgi:hypothetical protein